MPANNHESRFDQETAPNEAEKITKVLHRRGVIKPDSSDYNSANTKVDADTNSVEKLAAETEKNIEEVVDMVLFDWDGVLYDSIKRIARAAVEVCKRYGIDLTTDEYNRTAIQPYWEHYARLGIPGANTDEGKAELYHIYHNEIIPLLKEMPNLQAEIYPEVPEIFQQLADKNIKIGIVSAHKPEEIEEILRQHGLRELVDCVVGLAHNKVEALRSICSRRGLDPQRVLMFGDLPSDLQDAKVAGIKTAAVARFEQAEDRLAAFDPDYFFQTVGPEILKLKPFLDIQK
ncbi:MAG: hypothetical protein A2538_00625 [Candidatus Magasanikbacteria bacterium RIFOXYD2_FULL_41_14]|uniref:Haloacid dehalogenase n=1 Tax=Candidatus Magasanikbacteria bacterium RIFOXYD2_FULL_41_14 TaxID=1798709 RepID=A0A1F6PBN9_9BACT|nr:MAG: hypothetical protein A2538_00625 [Candidatus Magasanikbacteria bacterium RIFOXYD2_FULL_41_14]